VNGYSIDYADFYPATNYPAESAEGRNTGTIRTLVYIGTPSNPQFTHPSPGPIDPQDLAAHIYTSLGPSGRNSEYLLELDDALASLHENHGSKNHGEAGQEVVDIHVRDLADRVRLLIQQEQEEGHDTEIEEKMEEREEELEEEMERVLSKEEIEQARKEPEE
jgi:cation transport protein ChaC